MLDLLRSWTFLTPAQGVAFTGLSHSQAWRLLRQLVQENKATLLGRLRLSPLLPAGQWFALTSALTAHQRRFPGRPVRFPSGVLVPIHHLYVSETARWLTLSLAARQPTVLSEHDLRHVYGWCGRRPPKDHPNPWATYVPDLLLVFPHTDHALRVEVQLEPKARLWNEISQRQNDRHPTLLVCPDQARLDYYRTRLPSPSPHIVPVLIGDDPQLEAAMDLLRPLPPRR